MNELCEAHPFPTKAMAVARIDGVPACSSCIKALIDDLIARDEGSYTITPIRERSNTGDQDSEAGIVAPVGSRDDDPGI